ncbi:MAG: hypothetical protein V1674_02880 [Candidatus Omnitrophota bacterium]
MDWLKNNFVIGFLVVLVVICLVSAVGMASKLTQKDKELKKEIALRLQTEEQSQGIFNEKADLDKKIQELSKALDEEKILHAATKKELTQEQLVVKALKEELEKTVKQKESLEGNLKGSSGKK